MECRRESSLECSIYTSRESIPSGASGFSSCVLKSRINSAGISELLVRVNLS